MHESAYLMEVLMKHKIYIGIVLIFLSSCMKLKKKEKDAVNPAIQAQEIKSEGVIVINHRAELEYRYDMSKSSDMHQVHFYAPENWPEEVVVRKTDLENKSEIGVKLDEKHEWTDALTKNEKITYQFYVYAKLTSELVLLSEVQILPVLNLTVDEDLNLAKMYKLNSKTKLIYIHDLKIATQKHLFLEDYSGSLVIDHLQTENGFIQTFPLDSRAENNHAGKSGGELKMIINNGQGQLMVMMKGQDGGHGSPADLPDNSLKGGRGSRTVESQFRNVGQTEGLLTQSIYDCIKQPGEAFDGNPGLKGFAGHDGKSGGNTGSIEITSHAGTLRIILNSLEGAGGQPSLGGIGGEGGDPGDSADGGLEDLEIWMKKNGFPPHPITHKYGMFAKLGITCQPSQTGKRGPTGSAGDPGKNAGKNGIKQPSYLN